MSKTHAPLKLNLRDQPPLHLGLLLQLPPMPHLQPLDLLLPTSILDHALELQVGLHQPRNLAILGFLTLARPLPRIPHPRLLKLFDPSLEVGILRVEVGHFVLRLEQLLGECGLVRVARIATWHLGRADGARWEHLRERCRSARVFRRGSSKRTLCRRSSTLLLVMNSDRSSSIWLCTSCTRASDLIFCSHSNR